MEKDRTTRLLVLCSRLDPSPQDLVEINKILEQDPEWDWIENQAEGEGTSPLLYWNLRYFPQGVSEGRLERLKIRFLRNEARNVRLYRRLEPFLDAVRSSGVRLALTKGARLAQTVYPDIGLRPFGDIDCFVHPHDWPALKTLLKEIGFLEAASSLVGFDPSDPRLHWTFSPYFRKNELLLEFHFNYLGLHFPFGSEEDFWASTRTLSVGGSDAEILSPEYELCYLCLHAQQHSFQKLMWLADIAALVSKEAPDWEKVSEICQREGIRSSVSGSLQLVDSLWRGSIPRSVLACFTPNPGVQRVFRFFWPDEDIAGRRVSISWPYYMSSLFSLWERKKPSLAVRTLFAILFPPRAWISHVSRAEGNARRSRFYYLQRIFRPLGLALKRIINR